MAAGPETLLVNRMRAAVLDAYPSAFVVKVHGGVYQQAGLPDLLVVVRGRVVGIEAKAQRPGESEEHARERVTPRQQATLDAMERAGATVGCALTEAEALALVRAALRGKRT